MNGEGPGLLVPLDPADESEVDDRNRELGIRDLVERPARPFREILGRLGERGRGRQFPTALRLPEDGAEVHARFVPREGPREGPRQAPRTRRAVSRAAGVHAASSRSTANRLLRSESTYCSFIGPRAFHRSNTCFQVIVSLKSQRRAFGSYWQGSS